MLQDFCKFSKWPPKDHFSSYGAHFQETNAESLEERSLLKEKALSHRICMIWSPLMFQ